MSTVLNIVEKTKVCRICKETKELAAFKCNVGKGKTSLTANCQDCRSDKKRAKWAVKMAHKKASYIAPAFKICSRCRVEKPTSEFSRNKDRAIGVTPDCKECRNARYKDPRNGDYKSRPDRVLRKYGITYNEVKLALANQHGLCANRACGIEISLDVPLGKNRAVIDHCHTTGQFRALLCSGCNAILGTIETKKNILLGLIEYAGKFNK